MVKNKISKKEPLLRPAWIIKTKELAAPVNKAMAASVCSKLIEEVFFIVVYLRVQN
ncbi:MAG TPA: hypothetical protein VGO09_02280 [Flavisolibacter sp.]|jgi:hypothetical protein|nr:hypothetical protein [Flavisolibacter sp.]